MKGLRSVVGTPAVALSLALVLLLAACGGAPAAPAAPAGPAAPVAEAPAASAAEVVPVVADAAPILPSGNTAPPLDEVLVSTEWLAENLDNPAVRVIEVSVIPGVYERGHIPNAVNFVWHTDFVDTTNRDIVQPEVFEELIQQAGINSDTTVVLYGDNNNWFAAWGGWIFTLYGHADVRLLDGGRVKWEAEGRELTTAVPTFPIGNATVEAANPTLRVSKNDVLSVVEGKSDAVIIDIRSPDEYNGVIFAPEGFQELAIRAGHIPGAVNVPWGKAVNQDTGEFKSAEELRELYASVGVDGSKPVIVYCRIGERASHTWYALHNILGYDVAMYDGSWTEWGNSVGVPIANPTGTIWGAQ